MELSKTEIQSAFTELKGKAIFKGSDHFVLFGEIIETGKIENLSQLINHVFIAGMNHKIREVKNVLNISDSRF